VAGPYSWVASGGGVVVLCFPLCCCFYISAGFQFGYSGTVSCSSQFCKIIVIHYHRFLTAVLVLAFKFTGFWMLLTVFKVFIAVHKLALIRVRSLFLL